MVRKNPLNMNPTLNRRNAIKTGVAGAAALGLGQRGVRPARARQDFSGRLTVWGIVSFTPEGDQLLGDHMREWGERNGMEVEYVALPGSDYATRLATAVEANAVPDIAMMGDTSAVFYAGQNRLVELSDVYSELEDLAGGIYPTLLPNVSAGDDIYAIPMQSDVSVMYARLDLCEEVLGERRAPTTLEELEEVARGVTQPPRQFGIGLSLGRSPDTNASMYQLILAEGGTIVDEEGNPAIDNPGTVSALEMVKRWWDDGLIPPDATAWDDSSNNTSYQSRQSAFVFNPASIFAWLEANDPELLADTTQAAFPAGSAGSFPSVGTWAWSIFEASPNVEAAKAMLLDIMQPDMVQAVYERVGGRWYPIYRDLSEAEFWAERPFFDEFPEIIESSREMWYPAPTTPLLLTQMSAAMQRHLPADMVQDVVINGAEPAEAAATAQVRYQQTWDEAEASFSG